jgi:ABC-type bacteriocin/lantibiotic exporter with double-glycine peptidase domain
VPARAARGRSTPPAGVVLVCGLLAAGCAATLPRDVTRADAARTGWTHVAGVPEIRQSSRDGCGAAALAMVLGHLGRPFREDEIRAATPAAPGEGIRADALREFARGQGLQAFLVEGRPADLDRELGRSRPVLVGVVKRKGRRAWPHYEVVVGVNRERGRILTLDPARGRRERDLEDFEREWAAAGRLTLVVFPPRAPAAPVPAGG